MPQEPGNLRRAWGALAEAGRVLTGRQIAGRGLTVFPEDVFLVSYPRSGNTWTRFLLGNLIDANNPVTFSNIESRIPEIYFNRDRVLRRLPRPRLLKSHECFQPHYPHVIYVVRDPRDVAVSFYHHNLKARNIPDGYAMESFVPRFIAGEFDRKFGTWRDNVLSWIALRGHNPNFLMLRYEEMKKDTPASLRVCTAFLERCGFRNIDSSGPAMQSAIELSSPERMRELEKQEAGNWVLTRSTRSDKPFVRAATSGGWKSQLAPESVHAIESAWGDLMQNLGYELSTRRETAPAEAAHQELRS
ncbi:MAG TPA: sulfotransferase domain-containing protein [Candidatus Dormibacteraeota bacterium]|nr:sulfotransferase domain-containing protein [Candidatus Dormibacteraeota bacterium]